jgi:hypothetical protein
MESWYESNINIITKQCKRGHTVCVHEQPNGITHDQTNHTIVDNRQSQVEQNVILFCI